MNTVQDENEHRSRDRNPVLFDRLLALAEHAIAESGLDGVKARPLAEAAGCSVGAIYNLFPDLHALVLAVNGRTLDAISAAMAAVSDGTDPADTLVRLADTYLDFAIANGPRWQALFAHRLPAGRVLTDAYEARRLAAFSFIERPLAGLRPDLGEDDRAILARTLFSAVHGMVELGLSRKLGILTVDALREQVRIAVSAIAAGVVRIAPRR